jgi:hypothetical protein
MFKSLQSFVGFQSVSSRTKKSTKIEPKVAKKGAFNYDENKTSMC